MCDGIFELEGRTVLVTAYTDILINESFVAVNGSLCGDDTLGEQGERLCGLDGGAGSLWLTDCLSYIITLWCVGGNT